jgi:ATP-dependent Clp protease protease subunit
MHGAQPDRESQVRENLMDKRALLLGSPVMDAEAADVVARLKTLQSQSVDLPITLYINSPGGAVSAGLTILDAIQSLLVEVHTHCLGQAHSVAAIILAAGSPGHRTAAKDSLITFSDVTSGGAITPEKAAEHARLTALLIDRTSRLTRTKPEKLKELFTSSAALSANDAVALGIIDEVVLQRAARQ